MMIEVVMHLDAGEVIPEWKNMDWEATPEDLLKSCEAAQTSFEKLT